MDNYPGSIYREDALFYKFDSAYKLAVNSVVWKQLERTDKALKYYKSLLRYFPESKYLDKANSMHEELENLKNNITQKKLVTMDLKKVKAPLTSITYNRNEIDAPTEKYLQKLFLQFLNGQNR